MPAQSDDALKLVELERGIEVTFLPAAVIVQLNFETSGINMMSRISSAIDKSVLSCHPPLFPWSDGMLVTEGSIFSGREYDGS
jgi:hypothetical protein